MSLIETGNAVAVTSAAIVDSTGTIWTLVGSAASGLQIAMNGAVQTATANVVLLLYWNHLVYQQNNMGGWWYYTSKGWIAASDPRPAVPSPTSTPHVPTPTPTPAPTPTPIESKNGTSLTIASGSLRDAGGVVWTLVASASSGLQIARNGAVDTVSANVVLLLYYNHTVYQENASGGWWSYSNGGWQASFDPRLTPPTPGPTPTPATGMGPAISGNFINVDFASTTGQSISSALWGVCWGAPNDNNFAALADGNFIAAAKQVPYTYHRLNPDGGGYTEAVFGRGGTTANWSVFNNFINHAPSFIPPGARITIGIGSNVTAWSQNDYANICRQFVTFFKNNFSMPIWGWEIGNEDIGVNDKNVDVGVYSDYFNTGAAAIHSIDPNAKVMGPVANTYVASQYQQFISTCARNIGVIVYHGYLGCFNNPSQNQAMSYNGTLTSINQSIAGFAHSSGIADPIIMNGEWNVDGCDVNDNLTNYAGAVFGANWMLSMVNGGTNDCMGAVWELYRDSNYGMIGSAGAGGYNISPLGYMLSKASQVVAGSRVAVKVISGSSISTLSVINGNSTATMLVNSDPNNSPSGQVALSHWPSNGSGTGTLNMWQISSSHPSGQLSTVAVTGGLTQPITIPAASVVILYS